MPDLTPSPDSTAPEAKAKLLPCPFCGKLPISHLCQSCDEHGEPFYSYHEIACQNRECGMMPLVNVDLQEEDSPNCWSVAIDKALAAWNTRATRQESGEDSKRPSLQALLGYIKSSTHISELRVKMGNCSLDNWLNGLREYAERLDSATSRKEGGGE